MPGRSAVHFLSIVGVVLWAASAMAAPPQMFQATTTQASAPPAAQPQAGAAASTADIERPPAESPRKRRQQGLALRITGGAMLAAGYVGSAASYGLSGDALPPTLLIPIAGPWVALGSTNWSAQVNGDLNKAVVILQGLLQGTGILLLVTGLVQKGSSNAARAPRRLQMTAAPSPRGVSAGFAGFF